MKNGRIINTTKFILINNENNAYKSNPPPSLPSRPSQTTPSHLHGTVEGSFGYIM